MNIIVHGCTGRMGSIVTDMLESGYRGHGLAAGVSPECPSGLVPRRCVYLDEFDGSADCVVDFSHHSATAELTGYCVRRKLPLVVATTGQTEGELGLIRAAAEKIPLFHSANMSVGVALLARLARQAAAMFPDADIEIVEKHHNQKLDVPSGTALLLANSIRQIRPEAEFLIGRHQNGLRTKNEIGIHSLRYGGEVGTHEIIVSTGTQTITLKHEAESRSLFAEGAIAAAEFLAGKTAGYYTMAELVGE
ncbi:MAG: 4-hydroxy-tetrahydrodipicolinate reductase [Butyricicoccus sp.]|nr:4-hydroxy-tetrahydrodipicolinate reductase [Butyricicoccus sp.]